jgi:hypothetical protein
MFTQNLPSCDTALTLYKYNLNENKGKSNASFADFYSCFHARWDRLCILQSVQTKGRGHCKKYRRIKLVILHKKGGEEKKVDTMTSLRKDYVASHLRSQVNTLRAVLDAMENSNCIEDDYAGESLKRVEIDIRNLRKYIQN